MTHDASTASLAERDQRDIVAFLQTPAAYGGRGDGVERITTHISHIFLFGDRAYKLKRAVRLPYVDFSTLSLRHVACERELALNRRTAPDLYEGLLPVIRDADGHLRLGGDGDAVEWLVVMKRFDQSQLLDVLAKKGFEPATLRALGDTVAAFHATAEIAPGAGGAQAIADVIAGNGDAFAACPAGLFDSGAVDRFKETCGQTVRRVAPILDRRRDAGEVRRCHGDLHLGNICLIDGRPTLFDCLEFDETLSSIDVLYDLAFLLMDLAGHGLPADANYVFNRYADRRDVTAGLAVLPLFLGLRAAIRGHVTALKGRDAMATARSYLDLAARLIQPARPRLIAIGGLSGSGKSTMAYRLAPEIGTAPGARVVRSDVIRKRLFGLDPETRLGPHGYDAEATVRVYRGMAAEAAAVLATGHSAIVDAVFLRSAERDMIAGVARDAGVPYAGLWLQAPVSVLEARVAGRHGDASDADLAVLRHQADIDPGAIAWRPVDVSGAGESAFAAVRAAVA